MIFLFLKLIVLYDIFSTIVLFHENYLWTTRKVIKFGSGNARC